MTEGRLTEYERQMIRDMTVKVVSSLAAKWDNIKEGLVDGMISTLVTLVRDGLLDLSEGAKRANMTQEEFAKKLNDV